MDVLVLTQEFSLEARHVNLCRTLRLAALALYT